MDLGISGSYRKSFITEANTTVTESYTGSLAYYFWEYSALELSYTTGVSKAVTPNYEALSTFQMSGLDLIITFASKDAPFRPYVKLGGAYQKKRIQYKQVGFATDTQEQEGPSPSAGLGFRIALSQTFGIKAGVDTWTSPLSKDPNEKITYDFAARAGVSWLF